MLDADNNPLFSLPSSGVARAAQTTTVVGEVNGIPLTSVSFGEPEGLPAHRPDTFLVVSALTAAAAKAAGRTTSDILLVADTVRDDQGRIVGCRAFATV